jgi:Protein of unknown function with PCYCGC motif
VFGQEESRKGTEKLKRIEGSKRTGKFWLAFGALAAAALVVQACAGTRDGGGQSSGGRAAPEGRPATENRQTAAVVQTPAGQQQQQQTPPGALSHHAAPAGRPAGHAHAADDGHGHSHGTPGRVPAYAKTAAELKGLPKTLPAAQFFGMARAAYQAVGEIPQTIAQLPCYCYCDEGFGHKSLHSCFVDDHASHCAVCVEEALLAYRLQKEGVAPAQIRERIVAQYARPQ